MGIIKQVCGWCGISLGEDIVSPTGPTGTSHGICGECYKKWSAGIGEEVEDNADNPNLS